jgi:hypothetical protein
LASGVEAYERLAGAMEMVRRMDAAVAKMERYSAREAVWLRVPKLETIENFVV